MKYRKNTKILGLHAIPRRFKLHGNLPISPIVSRRVIVN